VRHIKLAVLSMTEMELVHQCSSHFEQDVAVSWVGERSTRLSDRRREDVHDSQKIHRESAALGRGDKDLDEEFLKR
jgi:hypothetical protein